MKTTVLTIALALATMSLTFAAQTPAPAASGANQPAAPAAAKTSKKHKKAKKTGKTKAVKTPAASPAPAK